MKKILFVFPTITQTNGVAAFAKNYISHIPSGKMHFSILCNDLRPSAEYTSFFRSEGRSLYFLPYVRTAKLTDYLKAIRDFFEAHHDFDLVYCHNGYQSYLIYYYARRAGIQHFAIHSHATVKSDNPLKSAAGAVLQWLANKKIDNKYACSTEAGLAMFKTADFQVIPNAIEFEKYQFDACIRKEIRSQFQMEDNQVIVGFVGRYAEQKNVFFFIELAKKLKADARILMIGAGNLKPKFLRVVESEGLADKFIFLDETDRVNAYYSAMDVFLLPSLYEGLPVSAIEAQANGLPCLLSAAISKETDISGAVQFLDIHKMDDWVRCINQQMQPRGGAIKLDKSFDIHYQSKLFENILNEISQ